MNSIKIFYELYFTSIACFSQSHPMREHNQSGRRTSFNPTSSFNIVEKFSGSI